MKLTSRLISLLGVLFLITCCFPSERIWWSPRGDRALVQTGAQLRLVPADGSPGEALDLGSAPPESAVTSPWTPDGQSLIITRTRSVSTWSEVKTLVSTEEAQRVEKLKPAVMPMLQTLIALGRSGASLDDILKEQHIDLRPDMIAAALAVREQDPTAFDAVLAELPDGKDIVEGLQKEGAGFSVHELCLMNVDDEKPGNPTILIRTITDAILTPQHSSRHPAIAFARKSLESGSEERTTLEVVSTDGSTRLLVAEQASGAFDWTPDGLSLVYASPIGSKGDSLQVIQRIQVLQNDGSLMKPQPKAGDEWVKSPDHLQAPSGIATAIIIGSSPLQVLPDGSVLFASQPATLPASGAARDLAPFLYLASPDGASIHSVPTQPGDLPADLSYFRASPDGRHIAIVESSTDAVAIVETETGRTEIISPAHPKWACRTIPAWKSATELTYAALDEKSMQPRWMLWSQETGVRCIGPNWPAEWTKDWLERPQEESTAPAKP